jgi:hypothetical protein
MRRTCGTVLKERNSGSCELEARSGPDQSQDEF